MQAPAPRCIAARNQHGSVLALSLLLLMIMTILGLVASRAIRTHEDIAGAVRDQDVSFQSAEAALRAAERLIGDPLLQAPPARCVSRRCQVYEANAFDSQLADQPPAWWASHAWAYSEENAWVSILERPINDDEHSIANSQFVIEEYEEVTDSLTLPANGSPPSRIYYRITAADGGVDGAPRVVLQSMFARRFK